jgi:UDP-N-acetyl-D-mannosaminuronic acid transferase (WecB/TagA/CpsF family)
MPINRDIPGAELEIHENTDDDGLPWLYRWTQDLSFTFGTNYSIVAYSLRIDEEPSAEMHLYGGNPDIFDAYVYRLSQRYGLQYQLVCHPFLKPDVDAMFDENVKPLFPVA